jgi:hypothetical protein
MTPLQKWRCQLQCTHNSVAIQSYLNCCKQSTNPKNVNIPKTLPRHPKNLLPEKTALKNSNAAGL